MNNTKKNKFNIVDAFVILILIAIVLGIGFGIRKSNTKYTDEKNITYTVCISGVDRKYLSSFASGQKVFNAATMNYIGTIQEVTTSTTTENGDKALPGASEGEYVLEQNAVPGVCDIYIKMTSKAKRDSRGVAFIDSERITIGSELDIRCNNFSAKTRITAFHFN